MCWEVLLCTHPALRSLAAAGGQFTAFPLLPHNALILIYLNLLCLSTLPRSSCSSSDAEAVTGLQRLAEANVAQWEEELRMSNANGSEDKVTEG